MTIALAVGVHGAAAQQQPPPAPSQVTPRDISPQTPPAPAPVLQVPAGAAAKAPPGAEKVSIIISSVEATGGYPEMAEKTAKAFAGVIGRRVSVADLYMAAGNLERAYAEAGYFLARVAVPQQDLSDGGVFHVTVIDGYFDAIDDSAVPSRIRRPVRAIMADLEGQRRIKLAQVQAKLNAAQAVPGSRIRSTIAQGQAPGAARLILDGGFVPFAASIGGDNGLGPSFDHWGVNVQLTANSPLGRGEQVYLFLSGSPRKDALRQDALRRVIGGGFTLPLNGRGLAVNPEFTVSDTHPVSTSPFFASSSRLYRGGISLLSPLPLFAPGSTSGKLTFNLAEERQTLPFFDLVTSYDRVAVLRANVAWTGAGPLRSGVLVDGTVSQGVKVFGAGRRDQADPFSRGGDPRFTKIEALVSVSQSLPLALNLKTTIRGQYAFNSALVSSETFDLTGQNALSSFTSGALSTDSGASLRMELSRNFQQTQGRLAFSQTPYLFGAAGRSLASVPDPFLPETATAFGVGVRFAITGLPFGGAPNLSLEYGSGNADRGPSPNERVQVSLGLSF